jgi:hypothetical protein
LFSQEKASKFVARCSVAVLERLSHTQEILLYLYINIELIFDYHRIYFGTATLQQPQHRSHKKIDEKFGNIRNLLYFCHRNGGMLPSKIKV